MIERIKKVAAVHDLSGVGRCSLTVVIPVLSAMQVQVCPLPTVVLSTHMGGFGKPASIELTKGLESYIDHWKQCDIEFNCLYSGYLANEAQIDGVKKLFETFKTDDVLRVVDPVMGDHGKLYGAYDEKMQTCMKELIKYADIITPNLTETYFLIGEPYREGIHSDQEIEKLLNKLKSQTNAHIVLKGLKDQEGLAINVVYDAQQQMYHKLPYEEIPAKYPGTGDIFTSVVIGYLMKGWTLQEAVGASAEFVREAVAYTYECGTPTREGILLEAMLGKLLVK